MRKWQLLSIALLGVALRAPCQTVTLIASHLQDGGSPATGTATLTPFFIGGQPASYTIGGNVYTVGSITATVTSGAMSVTVPDTYLTTPKNVCFAFQLTTSNGPNRMGPGYGCLQPGTSPQQAYWCTTVNGSTSCDLGKYVPALGPQMQVVPGPAGPQGPAGQAGGGLLQVLVDDASPITLNMTGVSNGALGLPLSEAFTSRTLNLTGLVNGDTFQLLVSPPKGPVTIGSTITWAANTAVTAGEVTTDANGHLQQVTIAGTTGATQPTWLTNGLYTRDGTAAWEDLGVSLALYFGTGCTWQNVSGFTNPIIFNPGTASQVLLEVTYDGANCNVTGMTL